MIFIEVCVGSSCYLKGAPQIVELLEAAVKTNNLENEIVLSGKFCSGHCNRVGVTVTVNGSVYTGITKENFRDFWNDSVMPAVNENRK